MRPSECHPAKPNYAFGLCHACYARKRRSGELKRTRPQLAHGHCVDAREFGLTLTYKSWLAIKRRCYDPNAAGYARYGGRGIHMCDEWRDSFIAFVRDAGERPSPQHSIDRINNDGNYEPGNVRWATHAIQDNNKSTNRWITVAGATRNITQWARELRASEVTISSRIRRGWTPERAVTVPVRHYRPPKRLSRAD